LPPRRQVIAGDLRTATSPGRHMRARALYQAGGHPAVSLSDGAAAGCEPGAGDTVGLPLGGGVAEDRGQEGSGPACRRWRRCAPPRWRCAGCRAAGRSRRLPRRVRTDAGSARPGWRRARRRQDRIVGVARVTLADQLGAGRHRDRCEGALPCPRAGGAGSSANNGSERSSAICTTGTGVRSPGRTARARPPRRLVAARPRPRAARAGCPPGAPALAPARRRPRARPW